MTEATFTLYWSKTWFIPWFGRIVRPGEKLDDVERSLKWVGFKITSEMWCLCRSRLFCCQYLRPLSLMLCVCVDALVTLGECPPLMVDTIGFPKPPRLAHASGLINTREELFTNVYGHLLYVPTIALWAKKPRRRILVLTCMLWCCRVRLRPIHDPPCPAPTPRLPWPFEDLVR